MNILDQLDQISFGKIIAITFVLALLAVVPVSVWVAQQRTQTQSSAYFGKPEPLTEEQYGAPPAGEPRISLVWPFVGKPNDAVLIHGTNFGNNPENKSLYVGNQPVTEDLIKSWEPELIEFLIPPESNFGPINLTVAGKGTQWNYPFTVYAMDTQRQVTEKDGIVWVKNPGREVNMTIYFRDGSTQTSNNPTQGVSYPTEKQIISVQVTDTNNNPLSFFVEPAEFGF
jgi:hypothetical protein